MFNDVTHELAPRTSLLVSPATKAPSSAEDRALLLDALLVQSRDPILLAESTTPDLACFRLIYGNPAFVEFGLRKSRARSGAASSASCLRQSAC